MESARLAGLEEADEGVETVFIGADDEAGECIRKQVTPGGVALLAPLGVGDALGGGVFEGDEVSGDGVVGGEGVAGGKFAVPRIIDAEAHRLIAAAHDGPALGFGAGGEVAEPDEDAVFGGGAGEEAPGRGRE